MARKKEYISPEISIGKLMIIASPGTDFGMPEPQKRFANMLRAIYRQYHIGRLEKLTPEYFDWFMKTNRAGVMPEKYDRYIGLIRIFDDLARQAGMLQKDAERWDSLLYEKSSGADEYEFADLPEPEQNRIIGYYRARNPKYYVMLRIQQSLQITNAELCGLQVSSLSEDCTRVFIEDGTKEIADTEIIRLLKASRIRAEKLKQPNLFSGAHRTSMRRMISSYNYAVRAARDHQGEDFQEHSFTPSEEPYGIDIAVKRMNAYALKAYASAANKAMAKEQFFAATQTAEEYGKVFLRILRKNCISRISELKQDCFTDHALKQFIEKGTAETTLAKEQAVIRKYEKIAVQMGWKDPGSPAWAPESPIGSQKRARRCFSLEDDEAEDLLRYLRDGDFRWYLMAAMQLMFGLRLKEVCSIRISSIDEPLCILDLSAADNTKGGRPRTVKSHHRMARMILNDALIAAPNDVFLFAKSNHDAEDVLYTEYPKALKKAFRALDLDHTKNHDLRRTFARQQLDFYLDSGMDTEKALASVSQDLGHGDSRSRKGLLNKYITASDSEAESEMGWLREYCRDRTA